MEALSIPRCANIFIFVYARVCVWALAPFFSHHHPPRLIVDYCARGWAGVLGRTMGGEVENTCMTRRRLCLMKFPWSTLTHTATHNTHAHNGGHLKAGIRVTLFCGILLWLFLFTFPLPLSLSLFREKEEESIWGFVKRPRSISNWATKNECKCCAEVVDTLQLLDIK